ncbi:MAG: hypothetical protein VYC39_10125 [Myxococcota bacterium]|nr:hypothetical protein [Myxococcota bacterium]
MKTRILSVLSSAILLGGFGCANVSALQTARALKSGERELAVGGGYFTMPALNDVLEDVAEASMASEDVDTSIEIPYLEVSYREGLGSNMDFGVKLTLIGTLAADFKYQLLDVNGFSLAAGVGLGAFYLSSDSDSDGGSSDFTMVDTMIPIYASYDVSEAFALYASPKYILRTINGEPLHLGGLTAGTKIGKDMGVYLELSYLQYLDNFDIPEILQFNAAYFF